MQINEEVIRFCLTIRFVHVSGQMKCGAHNSMVAPVKLMLRILWELRKISIKFADVCFACYCCCCVCTNNCMSNGFSKQVIWEIFGQFFWSNLICLHFLCLYPIISLVLLSFLVVFISCLFLIHSSFLSFFFVLFFQINDILDEHVPLLGRHQSKPYMLQKQSAFTTNHKSNHDYNKISPCWKTKKTNCYECDKENAQNSIRKRTEKKNQNRHNLAYIKLWNKTIDLLILSYFVLVSFIFRWAKKH